MGFIWGGGRATHTHTHKTDIPPIEFSLCSCGETLVARPPYSELGRLVGNCVDGSSHQALLRRPLQRERCPARPHGQLVGFAAPAELVAL